MPNRLPGPTLKITPSCLSLTILQAYSGPFFRNKLTMPDDRSILEQHKAVNSLLRVRVKELEADNVRHLADLNQVRTERDKFRNVAAKLRKDLVKLNEELVDCRNKYDVLHSAHEDSKRDIAAHDAVSKKRKIDSEVRFTFDCGIPYFIVELVLTCWPVGSQRS